MVRPTAGEAWVLGQAVGGEGSDGRGTKPWQKVGYLVETPHAYPELTVRENLEAVRRLRPGTTAQAVPAIIERLGLGTYADRRAGTLSLGNVQRLGLAKAMLHNPELLILDEPANGLDPAGIVEIRHFLRELAEARGVTIFLSSHLLGEVARVAQRIGIIHKGRLIEEMDVAEMERNRRRHLVVRTRDVQGGMALLAGAGYHVRQGDDLLEITDADAIERPDEVAVKLVQGGHPPTMLTVEQEELEQYFLRLVGMEAGAA
jgi:ABC-2 type transport system ATP-binding protein